MFSQVVIWGYPLQSHTHSQIHNGFYRAFQSLGLPVQWMPIRVDNPDEIFPLTFDPEVENTLQITMGSAVEKNIPLRSHSYQVLHHSDCEKQKDTKYLSLQCWNREKNRNKTSFELHPWSFLIEKTLQMPWASDLLPHEIDQVLSNYPNMVAAQEKSRSIFFVGYIEQEPWKQVQKRCEQLGFSFGGLGGYGRRNVSIEENQKLIQASFIAPAFQSESQIERDQLPCRIFKNISQGHFGITNNPAVCAMFPKPVVQDRNWNRALDFALKQKRDVESEMENIRYVRDHHTYMNRIQDIQLCFQKIQSSSIREQT